MSLFADKLYVDIIQIINKSESQRCIVLMNRLLKSFSKNNIIFLFVIKDINMLVQTEMNSKYFYTYCKLNNNS